MAPRPIHSISCNVPLSARLMSPLLVTGNAWTGHFCSKNVLVKCETKNLIVWQMIFFIFIFFISANIQTHWEIQCLLYEGFCELSCYPGLRNIFKYVFVSNCEGSKWKILSSKKTFLLPVAICIHYTLGTVAIFHYTPARVSYSTWSESVLNIQPLWRAQTVYSF